MAFTYTIDPHANLIHEVWTGTIDVQQLYARCSLEWTDPRYRRNMDVLSDFRTAQTEVSHAEMREFAEYMGRKEGVRRHAIVVTRQLGFGLARMFESLSESSSPYWEGLRVFFSIDEARAWIGERS